MVGLSAPGPCKKDVVNCLVAYKTKKNIRKANVENCKGCTFDKPKNEDHTCNTPWRHQVQQFFQEQLVSTNDIQNDLKSISEILQVDYTQGDVHISPKFVKMLVKKNLIPAKFVQLFKEIDE